MHSHIIAFNQTQRAKEYPDFRSGDTVKVYRKIKEGEKERVQIFEGIVIGIKGRQSSSPMMTVRKNSFGVGVEIIVPIFSPAIENIEIIRRTKVRRAKIYYARGMAEKKLKRRLKEVAGGAQRSAVRPIVKETEKDEQKTPNPAKEEATQEK